MYSQMVGVEYHLWFNKYKNWYLLL
jgi:hypothetical protein